MAEIPPSDWTKINDDADRFERSWKKGTRPRIEDYLADVDEGHRQRLFDELLRVEIELRRRDGEEPKPDDYPHRFPGTSRRSAPSSLCAPTSPRRETGPNRRARPHRRSNRSLRNSKRTPTTKSSGRWVVAAWGSCFSPTIKSWIAMKS